MEKCPKCGRHWFSDSKDRFQIINFNGQNLLVCPICIKKQKKLEEKVIKKNRKRTTEGTLSIIFGILGLITIYNWFEILTWYFIPFSFGMLAMITGFFAKKQGDTYGKIGFIIGLIVFVISLISIIAFFIYAGTSSMIG
jgi:hypothetical protein